MWILGLIIGGLIIGAVARLVVPGRNPIGLLMTIGLGIVGSLVGGLVARAIGAGTLIAVIIGVVVAALLVAMVSGSRRTSRTSRTA
jgi:uncharacterized membrane protein YeaQ/YmgE (transglycosylase-associated protein family)